MRRRHALATAGDLAERLEAASKAAARACMPLDTALDALKEVRRETGL